MILEESNMTPECLRKEDDWTVVDRFKRHQYRYVKIQLYTLHKITVQPHVSLPKGVKFEMMTLPVDAKSVADGDTVTVFVNTADPRESSLVPIEVQYAAVKRSKARAMKNFKKADVLHKQIIDSGYRVIKSQITGEEILAQKYRIRLRGIDAPESEMAYGKEATYELTKILQGNCLRVLAYEEDCYGRCVADLYTDDGFVQERMLKKGFAWHYKSYDRRPELAKWEAIAKRNKVGLWVSSFPEKPWDWRKQKRESDAVNELCAKTPTLFGKSQNLKVKMRAC